MLQLLLTAAGPFQRFIDRTSPTHAFINRQTLEILRTDRRDREAKWLGIYLTDFNHGCDWADTGWMNVGHMYDPTTGHGFTGWPSAPQVVRGHWDLALAKAVDRHWSKAFYYLGAAAHLVQDLCVPHHAAARALAGHKEFEAYACRYRDRYAADSEGIYDLSDSPEGWVVANATYARNHFSDCVQTRTHPRRLHEAVSDLLPRAQRTTAGFVRFFLERAGMI